MTLTETAIDKYLIDAEIPQHKWYQFPEAKSLFIQWLRESDQPEDDIDHLDRHPEQWTSEFGDFADEHGVDWCQNCDLPHAQDELKDGLCLSCEETCDDIRQTDSAARRAFRG